MKNFLSKTNSCTGQTFSTQSSPRIKRDSCDPLTVLRSCVLTVFLFFSLLLSPFSSSAQDVYWGGNHSYTTNTTFNGNAIMVGINAQWATIDVAANVTVTVKGYVLAYSGNSSSYTMTLTKTGDGTLIIESGVNYGSGCGYFQMNANKGLLQIGNGTKDFGTTNHGLTINSGGYFRIKPNQNTTLYYNLTGSGTFQYEGASNKTLTLVNDYTFSGTTEIMSGGVLNMGNGGGGGSVAGSIVNKGTLIFNHSTNKEFAINISGTGGVEKKGSTTLTLSRNLTYTGPTTVNAGVLQVGYSNSQLTFISNMASDIEVKSGAKLHFATANSDLINLFEKNLTGDGTVQVNCPNLNLSGVKIWVAKINVLSGCTLKISGNSTADITSDINNEGTLSFERTSPVSYTGVISGPSWSIVNKVGSGNLFLDNSNNTSTGTFYCKEGYLYFSGKWAGPFVKEAASTLMVSGNPSIGGKLTMLGGETRMGIASKITVTGALEASGNNILYITTVGPSTSSSYTLLTASSGVSINNFSVTGTNYSLSATPTTLSLVFVPVTGISNVPSTATATVPLTLNGLVVPENATNKSITWSVEAAGSTGATISGNTLYTTASGTMVVKATIYYGSSPNLHYQTSFNITVSKNSQNAPPIPTQYSSNSTSITLNTISGCEYNRDGGAWQSSPTFSGLTPSTKYTFTQRYAETPSQNASAPSPAAQFTTPSPEYTPIQGIYNVPATAIAGTPLTLTGDVVPDNATNQAMIWSIANAGTTGATIEGTNVLHAKGAGTVTVKVTIINGLTPTSPFEKNFDIEVSADPNFVSATDIINLPTTIPAGGPFKLTGTVVPNNATNQTITWSILNAGGTGAAITGGDSFFASSGGNVMILATIKDGKLFGEPLTKGFNVTVSPFVPATNIINLPTSAPKGVPIELTATITPSNASDQTIEWKVVYAGETGATITGNQFLATGGNFAIVSATIKNGSAVGVPLTKETTINITPFISVTDIVDVPTKVNVGTPLTLSGTILPENASDKRIVWSVTYAGLTGATITENVLTVAATGTLVVRATIENGKNIGESFTKEFTMNATVGITSAELNNQIVVYPNPTSGKLTMDNGQLTIKSIEIFDVYGRNVTPHTSYLTPLTSYDLTVFPAGIYFLKITTENGIVTKKVLKH